MDVLQLDDAAATADGEGRRLLMLNDGVNEMVFELFSGAPGETDAAGEIRLVGVICGPAAAGDSDFTLF